MKRNLLFVVVMFALAAGASAQVANFGGSWTLDLSRSKLGGNAVQGQVVTAVQTAKTITITTATAAAPASSVRGGRGPMSGGLGPADKPLTYDLEKEITATEETPMGPAPVSMLAKIEGNKLNLTRTVTMTTRSGLTAVNTKELWELSADGSTLTITTERNSPKGPTITTRVFTKKT